MSVDRNDVDGDVTARTRTGDRRSRRQVMTGAAGILAGLAAGSLGRTRPARADDGDPVIQGVINVAASTTSIQSGAAFGTIEGANFGAGPGVVGDGFSIGVRGLSKDGWGVSGEAASGTGVVGRADTGPGVFGQSQGGDIGVIGQSGKTSLRLIGKAGVRGYADQDPSAVGVGGSTTAGTGVAGSATTGVGVSASSQSGTALRVDGPAAFDGVTTFVRSGILTIQAGQKSATQIGVALEAASLVLAVAQQTGPRFVTAAVPHVAASSFTVYLNKAAVTDTLIGWFVVN